MSRMSGPKRIRIYEFLSQRDGQYCYFGGEEGDRNTLVIDHANNDNSDNHLLNLHLSCRSINTAKNPRGRSTRKMSSMCVCAHPDLSDDGLGQRQSAEMKKNQQAEPDFRHWLFIQVWRNGTLSLDEAMDSGAAVAHCSQESVKRYLRKECSKVRIYEMVEDQVTKGKTIRFKAEWEKCRIMEEGRRTLDRQARNWKENEIKEKRFKKWLAKAKLDEKSLQTTGEAAHLDQRTN